MLKDLCAYPREDRLKAITELEKDAGWPAYPLHVRVQMLHSYLNKKRAHPRARSVSKRRTTTREPAPDGDTYAEG